MIILFLYWLYYFFIRGQRKSVLYIGGMFFKSEAAVRISCVCVCALGKLIWLSYSCIVKGTIFFLIWELKKSSNVYFQGVVAGQFPHSQAENCSNQQNPQISPRKVNSPRIVLSENVCIVYLIYWWPVPSQISNVDCIVDINFKAFSIYRIFTLDKIAHIIH